VLRPVSDVFDPTAYPDLLVGLGSPDDAAVWRLDDSRALVLTTHFFTPVVDDPYDYGAIAAANSLSDVYAMGGTPFMALNIAALPPDLPEEMLSGILLGGAEKAREAGVIIAGGHTVQDKEPKYGLVVIGFADPRQIMAKGGARVGDRLVLTKPLGFGVTTTALKREQAAPEDVTEAVGWMKRLNRDAARIALATGVRGATDITGYSLLGHAWEMAAASGVGLRFVYEHIPFLPFAHKYAEMGAFPGGAFDNQQYFSEHVAFTAAHDEAARMLLFDPQTSGGLLLSVPADRLGELKARAEELDQPVWEVGEVVAGDRIDVF
jgi:selenide, water dikinase